MQTERAREAAEYRAQGAEQAQKITARADRDVIVLKAEAQQQADQIKGEGDAERNRIFAEAFGKDPDFFAFYRSMQAYESRLQARRHALPRRSALGFLPFFLGVRQAERRARERVDAGSPTPIATMSADSVASSDALERQRHSLRREKV